MTLARAPVAIGWVVAALVIARLAGWLLPAELAICIGLAVSMGLPGWALLCVTGLRTRLGAVTSWGVLPLAGLAAWSVPLALGLITGLSFGWVTAAVFVCTAAALAMSPLGTWFIRPRREIWLIGGAALLLALASLQWQPQLMGDALFHAGVIRKLLALPSLSLSGLSPLSHGHPHAGYTFPLLHAVAAGACKLTAIDASTGYPDMVPAFAFMLVPALYAGGRALAGPQVGWLAVVLAIWDVMSRNELGLLNQPGFFTFLVAIPASTALMVEVARDPDDRLVAWATVASAVLVAILHPTYAIPYVALLVALVIVQRGAWRVLAGAIVGTALVVAFIWLVAIRGGHRAATVPLTSDEFMIWHGHVISLSGKQVMQHRMGFLVALVTAPLLLMRCRRLVVPGALFAGSLALVSLPGMGALLTQLIGVGQASRLWEAIPWEAVTGIAIVVVAARLRGWRIAVVVVAVLVASRLLEYRGWLWGDAMRTADACPIPVWFSSGGAFSLTNLLVAAMAVWGAVVLLLQLRRRGPLTPPGTVQANGLVVFLLLVALAAGPWDDYGGRVGSDILHCARQQHLFNQTSPQLVAFLRAHDSSLPVVLAPWKSTAADWYNGIAYQLVGLTDVYAVAITPQHTRANPLDNPEARRMAVTLFLDPTTREPTRRAILQRYRVNYVVIDLKTTSPRTVAALRADPTLRAAHLDPPTPPDEGRFLVFQNLR